ncbi:DUF2383 domain-containing protein [Reichenbachiella agariperforans]|uniref:DUF2383 domain-containing protein n=1 Tax=Reichenbachiella agariperforans TaxID=156994 RepID=UPI001C090F6E|nr:DUF2383 domain-containing protein [Reichenbachiella agariperforans]MBU2913224.1 hypothetical protein [Reichenbachiella agariperforans]
MKALTPELQNLIDKLLLAKEIYEKASSRIHNEPMTNQMKVLAERKSKFLTDIGKLVDVDFEEHTMGIKDRLKAAWEKIAIEVEHIFLQRDEGEILGFCIQREDELIEMYQEVLQSKDNELDVFIKFLFESQLAESRILINELQETREAYNFLEK